MAKIRFWLNALAIASALAGAQVVMGGQEKVQPILPPPVTPRVVVPEIPYTLVMVGDIVSRSSLDRAEQVGRSVAWIIERTPNSMAVLQGDICNDESLGDECYDWFARSSWGQLLRDGKLITVPGNHDYLVNSARTYFRLFPNSPGKTGLGYQGIDHGPHWRIEALNSELPEGPERQEQIRWLRSEMREHHQSKCLIAAMHRPPYSSGRFASPRARLLTSGEFFPLGGDIVSASHDHLFDSIQWVRPGDDPKDDLVIKLDKSKGMHVFVVGTGGSDPYHGLALGKPRYGDAHNEVVITQQSGVLRLTLWKGRYDWEFVQPNGSVGAQGTGVCHDNPTN
ncbi:MAG: metallophosphoesterase [Candidatus Doudnabacteria bacterium]|nr:metallophosphoesterase [Candidatus Doudnabacteria bacterium]